MIAEWFGKIGNFSLTLLIVTVYGLLVGGPAAVPLGALLPLLYAAARGPRERVAAVLTLAQAGGSLVGAAALPLVILPTHGLVLTFRRDTQTPAR